MDKILFICEGEKTEKKFCKFIIDKYFIQNHREKEYVAFKTNIYGLYDEMTKDDGLDIIEIIREKAKKQKDMYTYNLLSNGGFSEVYLIFDFEFQAPQYEYRKIKQMLNFFNNETEHGKLYINYPMIESYKHFKSIPDNNYNTYKVNKKDCLKYKEYISNISIIPHFNDIDNNILKIIIKQNLEKYSLISNTIINTYSLYKLNFSQKKLLEIQYNSLKKDNNFYVINTILFWGIDYFGERKFNEYSSVEIKTIQEYVR